MDRINGKTFSKDSLESMQAYDEELPEVPLIDLDEIYERNRDREDD